MTDIIPKFDGDVEDWIRRITAFLEQREEEDRTPVGTIIAYASDAVPEGYLLCDGDEYLTEDYPALAKFLENIWGTAPSGSAYFIVPNLVDTVIVGGEEVDVATTSTLQSGTGIATAQLMYCIKW